MTSKLITMAEFSRLAGVNEGVVSRLRRSSLAKAMVGKRIDLNHPDAASYMARKSAERVEAPATGIDPFYERAVQICKELGRYTPNAIRKPLGIGGDRAKSIVATMKAAGIVPAKKGTPTVVPAGEPVPPPVPKPPAKPKPTKKTAALTALAKSIENDADDRLVIEIPDDIKAFLDFTLRKLIQRFGTDTAFLDWLNATKRIEDINEKRLKNAVTQGELVSRHLMKLGVIDPINTAHVKLLTDGAKTIAKRVTAMNGAGADLADVETFVVDQIASFIKPVKAKVARSLRNA